MSLASAYAATEVATLRRGEGMSSHFIFMREKVKKNKGKAQANRNEVIGVRSAPFYIYITYRPVFPLPLILSPQLIKLKQKNTSVDANLHLDLSPQGL